MSGVSRHSSILTRRVCLLVLAAAAGCSGGTTEPPTAGSSAGRPDPHAALVVYCAHDQVFSDPILQEFTRKTGIAIDVRHDTEATKSLGLVQRLIRERDNRQCDVFWNNQVLGTIDLIAHDLLEPYRGPGWQRIPSVFKDSDGRWCGFAARLRVWIVNTEKMPATDLAISRFLASNDLSRMAIARPLFGTTLTHYCTLWDADEGQALKTWHDRSRRLGLIEVPGNSTVKNLVARGTCHLGWTDTDDFFVGLDEGHPVAMRPIRLPSRHTICIPNSVAILRGTRNLGSARRLVDFLASSETELALARSPSRQIPLGAIDEGTLPDQVRSLRPYVDDGVPLSGLASSRSACLAWLRDEYQR